MALTIILFIFILGMIVYLHELGHFLAARRAGVGVKEFAFGFPPRLWARRRGDTTYVINLIPLGGYVKLLGEDEQSQDPRAFSRQSKRVRAQIIVAGVAMNIVFAWVLFSFWMGLSAVVKQPNYVVVTTVAARSVADDIGIRGGDLLVAVNAQRVELSKEGAETIKAQRGQTIAVTIKRFGRQKTFTAQLPAQEVPLGVSLIDTNAPSDIPNPPWWLAPYYGLLFLWDVLTANAVALWDLFRGLVTGGGGEATSAVVGPVGIVALLSQVISLGALQVVRFVGLLSLAVAVFNILPFPALDGGRLLFVGIESVFRRKISERIEAAIHAGGFLLLLGLFIAITYRDILRLLG